MSVIARLSKFRLVQIWNNPMKRQRSLFVWLGLLVVLVHVGAFMIFPIFSAANVSLRDWRMAKPAHPFNGFDNYVWALSDSVFWISFKNTVVFTVVHIALCIVLGLPLAVLLFSLAEPWKTIFNTVYFLPVMTSMVVISFVFAKLTSPVTGPLNYLLSFVGLGPYNYLGSSSLAMPTVIAMTTWSSLGYWVVLFLAGLTTIPAEVREAAAIDGASRLQTFFRIIVPLLRPTLVYLIVTGTISCLQVFTQAYILTRGGPGTATRTVVIHIYETGFRFFNMGRASAVAFILFTVIIAVSIVQLRVLREHFEY
jgi:ABC-type sugar transport system permease subunit